MCWPNGAMYLLERLCHSSQRSVHPCVPSARAAVSTKRQSNDATAVFLSHPYPKARTHVEVHFDFRGLRLHHLAVTPFAP